MLCLSDGQQPPWDLRSMCCLRREMSSLSVTFPLSPSVILPTATATSVAVS